MEKNLKKYICIYMYVCVYIYNYVVRAVFYHVQGQVLFLLR